MSGDAAANEALINRFYEAFARTDGDAMAACYTADAHFHDPVFQDLHGDEVGSMWRMLCERATDLEVEHSKVHADGEQGSAHWDASYTFSTGRHVLNRIDASFVFEDGLISAHRDRFDLYAWARQAIGPVGELLGWTPMIQGRIRAQARQGLEEFMAAGPAAAGE